MHRMLNCVLMVVALAAMLAGSKGAIPAERVGDSPQSANSAGPQAINAASDKPKSASAEQAAAQVDRLLTEELFSKLPAGAKLAPRTSDQTFLRRVYLDFLGRPPSPSEISAFALNPARNKRAVLIDQLLADSRYGENWARYWRDVMVYRRAADQGQILSLTSELEPFLADQFNRNVGWDEVVRTFITAKGSTAEHGETAPFVLHLGQPVEVAAETSRIFLGIQIQCAQCHDHPTDRWKRQQFHELVAFFPRVGINRSKAGERPTLEVASFDNGPLMRRDGMFGPGAREHFMPDLKNPTAQGTMMAPVFFVSDQRLETGSTDAERRGSLGQWLTAPSNTWFAKAVINRLWAEMVGEGFYEPVDDMGPDRACSAPRTMDYLAEQFVAHRYELKWLLRTIAGTEAYQRVSRPRRKPDEPPFLANVAQPLRADQLMEVLGTALGIDFSGGAQTRGSPGGARGPLTQVFGYDPSTRRDQIVSSIPQTLLLMNFGVIGQRVTARGGVLGDLLRTTDDEQVTEELYLRCLAREPNAAELAICREHVRRGDRGGGYEDVFWSLLNSEEIRYRE